MPGPSPHRLNRLLSRPGGDLAALVAHADAVAVLDRRLRPLLDPALAGHCRVAAFRDSRLILSADSSGWATRLRYHTERIREKLSEHGVPVRVVRVVVARPPPPPVDPPRAPTPPDADGARALECAADGVDYPPLAAALRRLAQNRR